MKQLGIQALACAATGVYAAVLTFGILKLIDATIGLRVAENEEREGLDTTQHGEEAYGESSGGMSHERERRADGRSPRAERGRSRVS